MRGGRGGMPTLEQQQMMMRLQGQAKAPEAKAIGKDVNQIERPAFTKHTPLDYTEYKKEMLSKSTGEKELPEVKVFNPSASAVP
jgi:hypothetical protein